jgi:hypothetical protein
MQIAKHFLRPDNILGGKNRERRLAGVVDALRRGAKRGQPKQMKKMRPSMCEARRCRAPARRWRSTRRWRRPSLSAAWSSSAPQLVYSSRGKSKSQICLVAVVPRPGSAGDRPASCKPCRARSTLCARSTGHVPCRMMIVERPSNALGACRMLIAPSIRTSSGVRRGSDRCRRAWCQGDGPHVHTHHPRDVQRSKR